jgi:hypothetical protein
MLILLLGGCSGENAELEKGMALRSRMLKAETVSFTADIEADYGDKLNLFSMECQTDSKGDMCFTVTAPRSIAGITGQISGGNGALTFGDTALHFELLTDDLLSPVSGPWILIQALRSGYLTSAGTEEGYVRLTIDDSYEEDALQVDVWLKESDLPERAEICHEGRRILTLVVKDLQIR